MALTKEQLMKEYLRCLKDTVYTLKTYLQTYDNTVSKYVPLELFPDQLALLEDYEKYNENIALKYRQAGVSTVTAAWISKKLVFANKQKPEKVLIIANKLDTSLEMANKVKAFITQYPSWMGAAFSADKNSQRHYKLTNGCEVKAVATSKDALRGFTPTLLFFDEAAFIEADSDFWAACMASLSCVHEDSYIFTDNGILQLKDIIDEKNKIGFTEYNGTVKVINKDGEITDIKNTFKSVRSVCYNVKTKSGFELTGSFKHPLLVNTDADNDEWVWMENLKIGDNIKLQFNQNLFGKDREIDFKLKHYNEKEKYKLPLRLSDDLDLCYLMGLFIAEGNYSENTIAITNGDNEIIDFLTNKGFIKSREHHYYYSSSYLTRFFQEYIGINKTKANGKKIPSIILKSSKDVIKAFLQGMFDGDGCAFKNGVKYTTTSKELASQLQILLLNFGIQSYIKYTEDENYNLLIKDEYVGRFFSEIGFRLKNTLSITEYRYDNSINYFYDEIVEIKSFEDDTYDLEIPNGNSFVSNGIISHNTGGHVIVVSTPNGYDPIYYEIYDQALRNMNDFKISEMFWYRDPRYTKDLYLVKTNDIIHYLLNKEDYKKDNIISWAQIPFEKRDFKELRKLMDDGYKPCSSWFEGMVKKLKYDKRKVSQELECVDGDTIITIKDKETNEIKNLKISELYKLLKNK